MNSPFNSVSFHAIVVLLCCFWSVGVAQESRQMEAAMQLFKTGEFAQAKKGFEAHLKSFPRDAEAMLRLGWVALEQKNLDAAVKWFERATRTDKTNSLYFLWLGRAHGVQAREAGIPEGAIPCANAKTAFDKAVALDPNNVEGRYDLIQWYLETPGIAGGSIKRALAEAEQIKRRDPYFGNIASGRVLEHQKKFVEAERAYQAARDLKTARFEAHYALGYLHKQTKDYAKALAAFETVLQLPSNEDRPYQIGRAEAYYQIGRTCLLFGERLDRGEEALKIYLQLRPNFYMPSLAWAHIRLGNIYEKRGRHAQARAEYEAALALEPDHKGAKAALKNLSE